MKPDAEAIAVRNLVQASRAHASIRVQRNISGFYARALKVLLAAARTFAAKSDEAWAAEVVELRAELVRVYSFHRRSECPSMEIGSTPGDCRCEAFDLTRALLADEG